MFGLFNNKLPDCNDLFVKYLSPWYPDDEKPVMIRPDVYELDGAEGKPFDMNDIQYLTDEWQITTKEQIQVITEAALGDFQDIIKSDKLDLRLLDAVDKFYDRKRIAEMIKNSDPTDFSNEYLVTVCELGATIGQLFVEKEGFGWLYSYPYFHSIIVHADTGLGITVFDWAVKKFSEYGVEDGCVDKFNGALFAVEKHPGEE